MNTQRQVLSAEVSPEGSLEVLSPSEVKALLDNSERGLYSLFKRCALAVLNSGSVTDDARQIFDQYHDFGIHLMQRNRGIKLRVENAPASAFVDGRMIAGLRSHLFAVLRDIIYVHSRPELAPQPSSKNSSEQVFQILRNAGLLRHGADIRRVVCWGGHSIAREEYEYSKEVGYQLGLRGLDICTGCGPGAMKGPMKGAFIGQAKQHQGNGQFLGITEPGIIASEPPNPIVNQLVVMPDIEKRLEAFVRLAHAIVVFPGGAGTVEELLYLFAIRLHPRNRDNPLPILLTGPASARDYLEQLDRFFIDSLGEAVRTHYQIIIDDPEHAGRTIKHGMDAVHQARDQNNDAFYYDWRLHIPNELRQAFKPTHNNMAALRLHHELPPYQLAAQLRCAFSGIVSGNVKLDGIRAVAQKGPFQIHASPPLLKAIDQLLQRLIDQGRMSLKAHYRPSYQLQPIPASEKPTQAR